VLWTYSAVHLQCCELIVVHLRCCELPVLCTYSVVNLQCCALTVLCTYSFVYLVLWTHSVVHLQCCALIVLCNYSVVNLQFCALTVFCTYNVVHVQGCIRALDLTPWSTLKVNHFRVTQTFGMEFYNYFEFPSRQPFTSAYTRLFFKTPKCSCMESHLSKTVLISPSIVMQRSAIQ
jgi:hypothetical protein